MSFHDLNWGDVPTWLATTGAFVAAIYAARAFQREVARDRRAGEMLEESQASLIAVWPDPIEDVQRNNPWGLEVIPRFRIRNASELPVYEVAVWALRSSWNESNSTESVGRWVVGLLPPADAPTARLAIEDQDRVSHVYGVQFRDAAGRTWHRDEDGILHRGPYADLEDLPLRLWDEDY